VKQVREILQTYLVIVFTAVQVFLVSRFCIDFFGTQSENSLFRLVRNISSFLLKPFDQTFIPSTLDGSTLDYTTLYAIIIYTLGGILTFRICKILVKTELHKKSLELVNLIFASFEILIVIRIVSDICSAGLSFFYLFVLRFTDIFIRPLSLLTEVTGDLSGQIAAVASMFVIGIMWFTIYKVVEGLSDTAEKLADQLPQTQAPTTPSEPIPIQAPVQTEKAVATQEQKQQFIQEPIQNAPIEQVQPEQKPQKKSSKIFGSIQKTFSTILKSDEKDKQVFQLPKQSDKNSRESPLA